MLVAGNLSVENGAHIVTQQFLDSFLILSGSGITFGLVIAMLFATKSKQYKALGKVVAFPALFNVNEPVVFGFSNCHESSDVPSVYFGTYIKRLL